MLKMARSEMDRLKSLNTGYLAQIDTLKSENEILNRANTRLNSTLETEREKVQNLSKQNQMLSSKIAAVSVLKTANVKAYGVKYRGNGTETEINRASSTEGIKTCFTVLENNVTDRGKKYVYLRVLSPDNAVMTTSPETFLVNNRPTLYTQRESFDYDNREQPVCIYWRKGSAYIKGKYTIELYIDGTMIGNTNLVLK
jgi:phosphopantetheinyl transferase (holo-ACP synthase)